MNRKPLLFIALWMLSFYPVHADASAKASSPYSATKSYYGKLISAAKPDVAKLRLFFTLMPKGGDIHQMHKIYAWFYGDQWS